VNSETQNQLPLLLFLSLFMLGISADHAHDTFTVDHLALITNLSD